MAVQNWLHLTLTEGLGPILCQRLVAACGGADDACRATVQTMRTIEGIGSAKASKIRAALDRAEGEVAGELDRVNAAGAAICCPDDADYPLLLREIPDPPAVLYVKGSLQPRDLHGVAIVGSRKCSFYGREQAERFGALLGGAGITVISGGARGIDSAAHRGALAHPLGRTIAVLGCGIDIVYPPENSGLFQQIIQRGAVVSEYPMGTAPRAENFPRRNRIVSGMSRGVLVVEAAERSGALITARQACDDHGRPVFAVPPQLFVHPAVKRTANAALSDRQKLIVSAIDRDSLSTDAIIDRCGLPASVVLQELTMLTLKGVVRRNDEGYTLA